MRRQTFPWQAFVFWAAATALACALYWLCLRFLFPQYFSPSAPFHLDFYDYAGARVKSYAELLRYPRPAAYLAMKIMGLGGLRGLMWAGIAVALTSVLLTIALARRIFRCYSPAALGAVAVYLLLLFSHPQFYFEHRHDLPAEVSYLFLLLAVLSWASWTEKPVFRRAVLLLATAACALVFVFAKETFFAAAPLLVAALAFARQSQWRLHAGFACFLVALEVGSLAWNRHLNGPFVNGSADAGAAYHISLDPGVLAATYGYYLSHLVTPVLLLLLAWALWAAFQRPGRLAPAMVLALSGLAVLVPHAVLPNHQFQEYAWAAAPLFLSPLQLLTPNSSCCAVTLLQHTLLAGLTVLAIAGPLGYQERYQTEVLRWMVDQEQRGERIAESLSRYRELPRPARVLVAGIEDASLPWQMPDFLRSEFGSQITWIIAFPPSQKFRRNTQLAQFVNAADVQLKDSDYLASYAPSGELLALRPLSAADLSLPLEQVLVPAISDLQARIRRMPNDSGAYRYCAQLDAQWGFWPQARACLAKATAEGARDDANLPSLSAKIRAGQETKEEARRNQASEVITLTAFPSHIAQTDSSGFGLTELTWRVPTGMAFEIHIDSPSGALFVAGDRSGKIQTGKWVKNGTRFFLQDVRRGNPLTAQYTAAVVTLGVSP